MKKSKMHVREHHGYYRYEFVWQRILCHEPTGIKYELPPGVKITPENTPKKLQKTVEDMTKEMEQGMFEYARHFPNGSKVRRFKGLPDNRGTLRSFVYDVWQPHILIRAQEHTVEEYMRDMFELRIFPALRDPALGHPALGDIRLKDLRPEHIERFIVDLKHATWRRNLPIKSQEIEAHPLSVRRINMVLIRLRQVLNLAYEQRLLDQDPKRWVKLQREEKPDINPLSLSEQRAFLGAVDPRWKPYFSFSLGTGARPSGTAHPPASATWPKSSSREQLLRFNRKNRGDRMPVWKIN
jgi:hypothetical protein